MKARKPLSDEQRERFHNDILAGMEPKEIAKKHDMSVWSVYTTRRALSKPKRGRPPGSGPKQKKAKQGVRRLAALEQLRAHLAPPALPVELTATQIQSLMRMLGRLGERHPKVFASLDLMGQLVKHPAVLLDVLE